jgi:hypothetical protein
MGTEPAPGASNEEFLAEGVSMTTEAEATDFLATAPILSMPATVAARLRAVIADEVTVRRTAALEPSDSSRPLKDGAALWLEERIGRR